MKRVVDAGNSQKGAVAITVALSLVVLLGFLGLVVDLGRLFVAKTELQNAADACSLAAARELDGTPDALTRAVSAGIAVGVHNKVGFQAAPVSIASDDITFSTVLSPNANYVTSAGANPATARYARCVLALPDIPMYFMPLLAMLPGIADIGPQTVRAGAVATNAPGQSTCALPMMICAPSPSSPPHFGLNLGTWYSGKDKEGGGDWKWANLDPAGHGAADIKAALKDGICNVKPGDMIGDPGNKESLEVPWNTRFGLYKNGGEYQIANGWHPDRAGYGHFWDTGTGQGNWSGMANAFGDFKTKRANHSPYSDIPGLNMGGYQSPIPSTGDPSHTHDGHDRRIVPIPVVNCTDLDGPSHAAAIKGFACMLMLHPIDKPGMTVYLEYVGSASTPGNPCATGGLPGSSNSMGPLVPTLVQ